MVEPLHLDQAGFGDQSPVRVAAGLIRTAGLRLPLHGLLLGVAAVPAWWVMTNSGHVPVASLLAWLLTVPLWSALSYPVGWAATGRTTHGRVILQLLVVHWRSALLIGLPPVAGFGLWVAVVNLQRTEPPLPIVVGMAVQLGVTAVLAVVTVHALTVRVLFNLPTGRSLRYGLALALRWPLATVGLIAGVWLLALAARAVGGVSWLLLPGLVQPCAVAVTVLLCRRGQQLEAEAEARMLQEDVQ